MEDMHIAADRIRELIVNCDALMNDAEEAHVMRCGECLGAFAALVLRQRECEREGLTGGGNPS
jgi:hypothetical protein